MKPFPQWRTGHYYSNSGLRNYLRQHLSPAVSPAAPPESKPFHHNSELREAALSVLSRSPIMHSIRTEGSVPYDPVFHTVKEPVLCTTRLRLKGFGERIDRRLLSTDTREYQAALSANPRVFHRQPGEFTQFTDACKRVQASPFAR